MKAYVEFEILEGAYEISCPDALCPHQGVMNIENDIAVLVTSELVEKHKHFRLNRGKSICNCTIHNQNANSISFIYILNIY